MDQGMGEEHDLLGVDIFRRRLALMQGLQVTGRDIPLSASFCIVHQLCCCAVLVQALQDVVATLLYEQ